MFTLQQNLLELKEFINFHNCLAQIENPHDLLSFEGRAFFSFSISFLQFGSVKLLYFGQVWLITHLDEVQFSSVQLLNHVRLFVTPWTATLQASLSITNSQSLLKLM